MSQVDESPDEIFGPLQLCGQFSYRCVPATASYDLVQYLKFWNHSPDLKNFRSVFSKTIRVKIGYIEPIIGLINVVKSNHNTYNIEHISVDENFRRQGLSKVLMFALSKYLGFSSNSSLTTTICVNFTKNNELDQMFTKYKFKCYHVDSGDKHYYIRPSTGLMDDILNS